MSEPIREIVRARDASGETDGISGALAVGGSTDESLRHFLELLRALDENGVLRLVHDLVDDNQEVIRVGVDWLHSPENVRGIQNLRVLFQTLQQIDSRELEAVAGAMARAVDRAATAPDDGERRGAFAVLRQLGDPEVNRGLRVFLEFLRALGSTRRPATQPP